LGRGYTRKGSSEEEGIRFRQRDLLEGDGFVRTDGAVEHGNETVNPRGI
jgi:hypothetical protein